MLAKRGVALAPLGLLACYVAAAPATAADIAVVPTKLVIVDKAASSGRSKVAFVAKDSSAGITKGAGFDRFAVSARFDIAYDPGNARGAFVMPENVPGHVQWITNTDSVAKFTRGWEAVPPTTVKVALIRTGTLLKLVAHGLGEEPIDVLAAGAPAGSVVTSFCIANDGEVNCHCSDFPTCVFKPVAAGTGAKLVCKGGVGDPFCRATVTSFPVCCALPAPATFCEATTFGSFDQALGQVAFCDSVGGTLGAPGTVCDASGGCVPPPGAPGTCCEFPAPSCIAGPVGTDQTACEDIGGTFFASAVCGADGLCQ
jgi:hypothetical protein